MIYLKHISVPIFICSILFFTATKTVGSDEELPLFNSSGKATAYIAEDLTIYLWFGKPVAYLSEDNDGGFHVYGFNGKHLGWFVGGAVYDHNGKAVGAVAEVFRGPVDSVPFKGNREFKPFKDIKETPPFRPTFTHEWSILLFKRFLMRGKSNG